MQQNPLLSAYVQELGIGFKVEKKKVAKVSSNMFYYAIVLVIQIR